MKINKNEGFQPITIVIETQGEADLLAVTLETVTTEHREGDMLYRIYRALDRKGRKYKSDGHVQVREA